MTASGPTYQSVARKELEPGRTRIVVYTPESAGAVIKVDGQPIGTIARRSFIFRDVPAGLRQLTGERAGFPGITRREFVAAPGRTYYFMIATSQRGAALQNAAALTGLVGYAVVAAATTDGGGPVDIFPVDEVTARQAIAGFKMADQ